MGIIYKERKLRLLSSIILLCLPSLALADVINCSKWQYASLSIAIQTKPETHEAKDVYSFVLWEAPNEYGMWQNNDPLQASASIRKSLTEHFGIKAVHAPSILNKLGLVGWEAYGFHLHYESDTKKTSKWQFKKCSS